MSQIELTETQREILNAVIDLYLRENAPVSSEAVADAINQSPGTLRNNMQSLKAHRLVAGIPGVKGGYKPTAKAYTVLDVQGLEDPEPLTLAREFDRVSSTVEGITFTGVNDPDTCRARIEFQQPVDGLEPEDAILVGPTPVSKLVVGGEVVSVGDDRTEVIVDVVQLVAPLDEE